MNTYEYPAEVQRAAEKMVAENERLRAALKGVMTWINEHGDGGDIAELWVMARDAIADFR